MEFAYRVFILYDDLAHSIRSKQDIMLKATNSCTRVSCSFTVEYSVHAYLLEVFV